MKIIIERYGGETSVKLTVTTGLPGGGPNDTMEVQTIDLEADVVERCRDDDGNFEMMVYSAGLDVFLAGVPDEFWAALRATLREDAQAETAENATPLELLDSLARMFNLAGSE